MSYTTERLLQRAIYEGLLINGFAIEELTRKGQDYLEGLSSNSIDQMDDIIDLIYEEYPNADGIWLSDLIDNIANNCVDTEIIQGFNKRQLEELAEVYADCIMNLVKGYNEIAGAGKG